MEATFDPLERGDPRRISEFTLQQVIGSGGMGRVYLGRSRDDELVAVKVVHQDLARNPEFVARFRREVEAARSITVPFTASFVDADPDASRPWLATSFIDGLTLQQQVVRDGPVSTERVLRYLRSLAGALETIHRHWVHRDLKPSNIVVDVFGAPHIIDFGIIARAAQESGLTQEGRVFGTYGYMSPEQRRGERTGPATDIYALGATAYFAATGKRPDDDPAGLDPDAVRDAFGDPDVAQLVLDCTAADPARRPDARTLADRAAALPAARDIVAARDTVQPLSTLPPVTTPPADAPPATMPPATMPPADASPTTMPPADASPATPPPTGATGAADASAPRRRPRRGVVIAAAAISLVVLAGLGVLLPQRLGSDSAGSARGCAAVKDNGGLTFVAEGPDGQCYGVTDTAGTTDGAESGFGRDPDARGIQAQLFSTNRLNPPRTAQDLTVIYFGSLTCPASGSGGVTCADGREYDAERQELQALHLTQQRRDLGGHVHVVVANAGSDMRYAREAARLVVQHRAAFGRAVAVGGGDSRVGTKEAFRSLVAAGIPFIAPALSADDDGPGLPFIDVPGFLQMQRPNQTYARALISFIARHSGSAKRQVLIYRTDDPTDLYTASFARDVQFEARSNPTTDARPARIISTLDAVPASVCRRTAATLPRDTRPPALVFADRWSRFGALTARLTALCGDAGPAMLVGDDSVNRFMTNDKARAGIDAPWPLAYVAKGAQCAEIDAAARRDRSGEAATLLRAVRASLSLCDPATGSQQMGYNVPLFWDAVLLGQRLLSTDGNGTVRDLSVSGSNGTITVRGGQVVWGQAELPRALCVLTVDRSGAADRSVLNCDRGFADR